MVYRYAEYICYQIRYADTVSDVAYARFGHVPGEERATQLSHSVTDQAQVTCMVALGKP